MMPTSVIVIVIVNTTSYIAPLMASHFYDASQERSLSALYLMLVITDQVQFQLFFESRKGFGCPNSCRKAVPSTWTFRFIHTRTQFVMQRPIFIGLVNKVVVCQLSYSIETFLSFFDQNFSFSDQISHSFLPSRSCFM